MASLLALLATTHALSFTPSTMQMHSSAMMTMPVTSSRVAHTPRLALTFGDRGDSPLDKVRRLMQLQEMRQRRQEKRELRSDAGDAAAESKAWDAEAEILQRLLPFLLVLLLTVGNVAQISHVLQQLQFVDATQSELGSQLDFDLVTDMLQGSGELNGGLSNVIGQAVAESLGGPVLLSACELFLNAALARAFGRRLVPLLLVGEAAVDAVADLAGQPIGDVLGDTIGPMLQTVLSVVAEQGSNVMDSLDSMSTVLT